MIYKNGIDTGMRTTGKIRTTCPQCSANRKKKREKTLAIDLDKGVYYCHHCQFAGVLNDGEKSCTAKYTQTATTTGKQKSIVKHTRPTAEHVNWMRNIRHIPEETLVQMHITSATQYMPATQREESCICFNFYESGIRVNTKFRTLQKAFKMIPGAPVIPYNIDGIIGTSACIITEGEIDALSFVAAGRTDVISVPSGANTNLAWMDRFMSTHFNDKEVVYIAVDRDPRGEELRQALFDRLGAHRCRIVAFGDKCKDANEHLVKYGPQSLLDTLDIALQTLPEGVFAVRDVQAELRRLFEEGMPPGADTGWTQLDECCTFEPGRLCILTGVPGSGKSEFLDELVIRLAMRHGWKAVMFSPENHPVELHICKLMEKVTGCRFQLGDMSEYLYSFGVHWLADHFSFIAPEENFSIDHILGRIAQVVVGQGARTVVLDPFNCIDHRIPVGMTETQYIGFFLEKLRTFARRYKCLLILAAHPRKMNNDIVTGRETKPSLYDVNGSAHFYNKADYGLVVERDYEADLTRVHVDKVRFRYYGTRGMATFAYNINNGRYTPCPEENKRMAQFDNSSWVGGVEN